MTDHVTAQRALACLDLTNLNDECDVSQVEALCAKADSRHGPVAAVCVWPQFVREARILLPEAIKVATVVNFPSGDEPAEDVIRMTQRAVSDGASEIDFVIPYRDLLEGLDQKVLARTERVARAAGACQTKAILETGVLETEEMIRKAAHLAIEGGADFLKTSTGKTPVGASLSAAEWMLETIADENPHCGFKASGGVRTAEQAAAYLELADGILGEGYATPARFRIGASGLLDALSDVLG